MIRIGQLLGATPGNIRRLSHNVHRLCGGIILRACGVLNFDGHWAGHAIKKDIMAEENVDQYGG